MQNKFEFKDGGICAAKGFKANGTYCGIKKPANDDPSIKHKNDICLYTSDVVCNAAAVYTQNKVKGAPHPCRWLLTLRRIPARGSGLHVAFGRAPPGTNCGITVSFACCRHGKRQKECQGPFTF